MPAGRHEPPVRKSGGERKLGEILAQHIEDEIISGDWPVGTVVGSEAELMARYGVSRAVFREAMRLVDHHGVAAMRRGPRGGLMITEPDIEAGVRAVSLHLRFQKISPGQVAEARNALDLTCVRLAAERITPAGAEQVRASLDDEHKQVGRRGTRQHGSGQLVFPDFHLLLARLTGNPAMGVFVQMINRVLGEQEPRERTSKQKEQEAHRAHERIAEAVLAGDADTAVSRMSRHLDAVRDHLIGR
ncbi:MAG TPA: FCD domain-containing protein [Mycobacteriales bacterium]|nr:FCD domain-containing protein [Mycobacteriales bacterium]